MRVFDIRAVLVAASLLACAGPAAAEGELKPLDPPDPARISVPDISAKPGRGDASDYDVHFFFHKPGVTYRAAFADLDECRMYALTTTVTAEPPRFVPLGSDTVQERNTPIVSSYGLIGVALGAFLLERAEEESDRITVNRCMAYKGYARYGTSKAVWNQITAGSDAEKLAREALIASGPKPAAEAIDP